MNLTVEQVETRAREYQKSATAKGEPLTDNIPTQYIMDAIEDMRPQGFDPENQVAFIWSIDDVQAIDSELTDEQAFEVLQNFESNHDGSQEAMWNDLEYHVGEFKQELEA